MAFHIDRHGNPGPCHATVGACPYGGPDEHYTTVEDAQRGYEEDMAPETLPPVRHRGTLTRQQAIELDQFFTKDEVALACMASLESKLADMGYDADLVHFVEPSAGGGSFVRAAELTFPGSTVLKGDLAPKDEDIVQLDFINDDYAPLVQGEDAQRVVIGNPPFGYKARLAKDFVNRALEFSDTVVMVLPVQFQKYGTQKDIAQDAKLIHDETLDRNAFTVNGTDYGVQCCFQIWTKRDTGQPDLRRRSAPPITHPDFDTWIVSSKPESKRHLTEADWDYAVVTQGFQGQFELIARADADQLSPKRQYMLMRAKTPQAHERLRSLNYEDLAARNTTRIKGFGKADLVEAYAD